MEKLFNIILFFILLFAFNANNFYELKNENDNQNVFSISKKNKDIEEEDDTGFEYFSIKIEKL